MKKTIILCVLFLSIHGLFAQKIVDEQAYQQWRRIDKKGLSYNGNWMFYGTVFQDIEKANTNQVVVQQVPKGKRLVFDNASDLKFIGQKDWIQYSVKDSTFLYNLKSDRKILWKTKAYTNALSGTDMLYYTHPETKSNTAGLWLQRLVCYNLESNDSLYISNVKSFRFLKSAKSIVYAQVNEGKVFLKKGILGGKQQTLYSANVADFGDFELNKEQNGGTFTLSEKQNGDFNLLYYFNLKTNLVHQILNFDDIKIKEEGYSVLKVPYAIDDATSFIQLQLRADNRLDNERIPKSNVEIWRSAQGTMERRTELLRKTKNAPSEQKYLYDLKNNKAVKVSSVGQYDQLMIPESGNYKGIFAIDKKPYSLEVDWTFNENFDLFWIDALSGQSKKVATTISNNPNWNPQGSFAVYYDNTLESWLVFDSTSGVLEFKNCSAKIPFAVANHHIDMGVTHPAYGLAGWLDGGNTVLVYDEFDIWAIDLTNQKAPYSLTKGYGRKNKITLRINNSAYGGDLSGKKSIVLTGFDNVNKSKGIYKFANNTVTKLAVVPNYNVTIEATSDDNSSVLFSKESYTIFPDLWWGTSEFSKQQQITDVNPQQKEYAFGTSKLITWKDFKGKENQGNLYLPENYDPKKTYPVLVNFYEKHTEELNQYHAPEYSISNINIPSYVSRGYVVFQPDVHYEYGAPGNSVYNDVISGVNYLISNGITEKGKIGIQGHSFGGYETSFLLTKTDVFSCAIVGSGVSNFTANYLTMRSNGLSNMFKYESDQYRMSGSLFDNLEGYIKNSPIFFAKNVTTPVLIFHNDNDRAVPFQEGMALFLSLRRLGKEALLINYKNENHTLDQIENQKDWTNKMQQYFDYYLKGSKRPDWM